MVALEDLLDSAVGLAVAGLVGPVVWVEAALCMVGNRPELHYAYFKEVRYAKRKWDRTARTRGANGTWLGALWNRRSSCV